MSNLGIGWVAKNEWEDIRTEWLFDFSVALGVPIISVWVGAWSAGVSILGFSVCYWWR